MDDEVVILNRETGEVHRLNHTASYIWDLCDGTHTAQQIAEQLASAFDEPVAQVSDDIQQALTSLRGLGLLAHE
jgi:pyrroloquinoline quinone biosynthesis protein D